MDGDSLVLDEEKALRREDESLLRPPPRPFSSTRKQPSMGLVTRNSSTSVPSGLPLAVTNSHALRVTEDVTSGDEEQQEGAVSTSTSTKSINNEKKKTNGKKKKKQKKESTVQKRGDPGAPRYSKTTSMQSVQTTATVLSSSGGGAVNRGAGGEEYEESRLLPDTFTFLMTARYPLSHCVKKKKEEDDKSKNNGSGSTAIMQNGVAGVPTAVNNSLKENLAALSQLAKFENVDADRGYLPFWTGCFVNISQVFIYAVVIANLFVSSNPPPNADRWLRLAQIFAVTVTLYTQSDFIDGVFLLTEGWKGFKEVTTPLKFNVSASMRIVSGNAGILATFILVMYSTDVLGLLLGFTAMEFVATLDSSAFEIASKGFLGMALEKKAFEIQEFRYRRRLRKRSTLVRLFAYSFYVCLVFAAFFLIVFLQSQRAIGVENEVYVQFDDTDVIELSGVSGVYKGCQGFRGASSDRTFGRGTGDIGYVDISYDDCPSRSSNGEYPAKTFLYCWELDGWVYIAKPTMHPCRKENYLVRSFLDGDNVDLNAFNILSHSNANWIVNQVNTGGQVILDFVFIESVQTFEFAFKGCSDQGLRFTDLSNLRLDLKPLPSDNEIFNPVFLKGRAEVKQSYIQAFPLMYRQVFRVDLPPGHPLVAYEGAIFFDGLRWIAMAINPRQFAIGIGKEDECPDFVDDPKCWRVFLQYFHASKDWLSNKAVVGQLIAISEPMLFLTPSDTGVPTTESRWYFPEITSDKHLRPGKEELQTIPMFGGSGAEYKLECAPEEVKKMDCEKEEVELILRLNTDLFPLETSLLVFFGEEAADMVNLDANPDKIIVEEKSFDFEVRDNELVDLRFKDGGVEYQLGTCVPDEKCVQVVLLDEAEDGLLDEGEYEFTYDRRFFVFGGDSGWGCRSYRFGSGCPGELLVSGLLPCSYAGIRDNYYPGDLETREAPAEATN